MKDRQLARILKDVALTLAETYMDHYTETAPIGELRRAVKVHKGTTDPKKRLLRMKCSAEIRRRMNLIKGG